jgi:hypothetical protein
MSSATDGSRWHGTRAAPRPERRSGNDAPTTVGDEFADSSAAQSLGLSVLAGGLGIREGREKFESAAAPIGV